jgi:hypothetical protein
MPCTKYTKKFPKKRRGLRGVLFIGEVDYNRDFLPLSNNNCV